MKRPYLLLSLLILILSCTAPETTISEMDQWKLGWRMILSSMDKDYLLAEAQFDSILANKGKIENRFMTVGMETLYELDRQDKISAILQDRSIAELQQICKSDLFTLKLKAVKECENIEILNVQHPSLQNELIKMYVDDQAARGNLMEETLAKYGLDKGDITTDGAPTVDERNRERLKEIFTEHGIPTRAMVGAEAMHGIFMMIQHADRDPEWQKNQLENIKEAVKCGDMDGQSYAYLYDRIMINSGEMQLYGTQFSHVDPINKTVALFATERIDSLDYRRMEVGMMPIEMYKNYMLKLNF